MLNIILTISICLNVFQFIMYIDAYSLIKQAKENAKETEKEIDELIKKIKEKLENENM